MNNMKIRVLKFATFILCVFCITLFGFTINAHASEVTGNNYIQNDISIKENSNTMTQIHWKNNNTNLSSEDVSLFEEYDIDDEEALASTDIYIQTELIPFEETVSKSMLSEESIMTMDIGDSSQDEFVLFRAKIS